MKFFLAIVFSFFVMQQIDAQRITENDLRNANDYFNEGRFDDVIRTLKAKKLNRLNNTSKGKALKLLSAAFYEIDEVEKGDSTMKKFLAIFPLYQIDKTSDPEAFITGLHRFFIKPNLSFGFNVGINTTGAIVDKRYTIVNEVDYSLPYKSKAGFNGQLFIERYLFYNLVLIGSIDIQTMGYSRTLTYIDRPSITFVLEDNYLRLETPLKLGYHTNFRGFTILPYTGLTPTYSRATTSTTYNKLKKFSQTKIKASNLTNRRIYNLRFIYGIRIGIDKSNLEFFADLSRKEDILPAVLNNYFSKFYYPYFYVDDNFYLNNTQLSFGISIHLNYKVSNRYE